MSNSPLHLGPKILLSCLVALALSGCFVTYSPGVDVYGRVGTDYYSPPYYRNFLVYYDDSGLPYYYRSGRIYYVPRSYARYNDLVAHYRRHRSEYHRWYRENDRRRHQDKDYRRHVDRDYRQYRDKDYRRSRDKDDRRYRDKNDRRRQIREADLSPSGSVPRIGREADRRPASEVRDKRFARRSGARPSDTRTARQRADVDARYRSQDTRDAKRESREPRRGKQSQRSARGTSGKSSGAKQPRRSDRGAGQSGRGDSARRDKKGRS